MNTITYIKGFITDAAKALGTLSTELSWVRRGTTPRMEYYINEINIPYTYGKGEFARTYEPQPMHAVIKEIQDAIENFTKTKFEVCFLNRYINQSDHLGWHADDSPEMDDGRPIAIVSLGVEREIWFRDNETKTVTKKLLENGSLCLMHAGMQDTHEHRIPKASKQCGERISLTFRGYKAL